MADYVPGMLKAWGLESYTGLFKGNISIEFNI